LTVEPASATSTVPLIVCAVEAVVDPPARDRHGRRAAVKVESHRIGLARARSIRVGRGHHVCALIEQREVGASGAVRRDDGGADLSFGSRLRGFRATTCAPQAKIAQA
jgi:hypothetical protein